MRLKEARKAAGLTQVEVAKQLGINQNTYSYWENGRSKIDNVSISKLATIFNVSIDYLLGRDEKPKLKNVKSEEEFRTLLNYYKEYPELADKADRILAALPQMTDETIQKFLTYLSDLEANPNNLKAGESSVYEKTDSGRSQDD